MDLASIQAAIRGRDLFPVAFGLGAALLIGYFAGTRGLDLLSLAAAGAGTLLILARPIVGVVVVAALIPIENLTLLGGGVTALRVIAGLASLGWLGHKLLRRQSWKPLLSAPVVRVGCLFILLALASTVWARYEEVALAGFFQLLQLFVLGLLVLDLATTWRRLDLIAKLLVTGSLVAAALTLHQYASGSLRRAGGDVAGGVNSTAVVLLTLLPFGFYLIRSPAATRWRLLGLAAIALTVVAIFLTFSRMNFLLLPPVLLAQYWTTLRGRRGRGWLLGLTIAGTVACLLLVPWTLVRERAATITPYLESAIAAPDVVTLSDRAYHLRVGLEIFLDHPLVGAGYDNYGQLFLSDYQYLLGGAKRLYRSARNPHSSYVGILADLGAVGACLWVALMVVAVRGVVRAWRATRGQPDSPAHIFIQALACSVLLHVLAYGWYLPNQKEKIFWVLLAMTAAVSRLTAPRPAARPTPAPAGG